MEENEDMLFDQQVATSEARAEENKNGPSDKRASVRMSVRRPEEVRFRPKDEAKAAEALREEVEGDSGAGSA